MADTEHGVNINITGDSTKAVGALGRVKTAITAVSRVASTVSRAFGIFGLAVQGVQALVHAFQWLKDKATEAAREIAKFKWDLEMRNAANETARLVSWHEKLAKLMRDELDTLSKQQSLQNLEQQGKKDYEDGKREADRARQIFEAKSPEEEQALRDRFAAEDEQLAREERKTQRKQQIERLDKEESDYSAEARSLKDNNSEIDRQIEKEKFNRIRAVEDNDKEAIDKRIATLELRKKANEAEIALAEKEAKFRRDQIAALENQKDYEGPTAGEWQRKTEARKRAEDESKVESDNKKKEIKKQQATEDAALKREKAEAILRLDPTSKNYDRQKAMIERQYNLKQAKINEDRLDPELQLKKAEKEKDDAISKLDPKDLDYSEKIDEIMRKYDAKISSLKDNSSEDLKTAREDRKTIETENAIAEHEEMTAGLSDYRDRIAAADGVSQNRLTAMGLGAGVQANGGMANDVRKLVDLLKQEVEATKNIKTGETSDTAVYGD